MKGILKRAAGAHEVPLNLQRERRDGEVIHIIFMIDNSASMKKSDVKGDNGNLISRSKAVHSCITAMLKEQRSLPCTSQGESCFVTFIIFDDKVKESVGPFSLANAMAFVTNTLSKTVPRFGGKYGAALSGMTAALDKDSRCKDWSHVAVLLTDGRPGDSGYASIGTNLMKRYKIEFQFISFGTEGKAALEDLSAKLKGNCHNAGFVEKELAATFRTISTRCSTLRGDVSLNIRTDIKRETSEAWRTASSSASEERGAWVMLRENPDGWAPRHVNIRMHQASFAEGSLRLAYHAFYTTRASVEKHLVMKESRFEQGSNAQMVDDFHRQYLETHSVSSNLAKQFKARKHTAFEEVVRKLAVSHKLGEDDAFQLLSEALTAIQGVEISATIPSAAVQNVMRLKQHPAATVSKLAEELVATVQAPRTGGSVAFVPAMVMCLPKGDGVVNPENPPDFSKAQDAYSFFTVETYLEGKYVKMCDNNGWVNYDVPVDVMNEAAAFSHFTFEHSAGGVIAVDIQGVGRSWTDPQLHSKKKKYGLGDLGTIGMQKFFASHRCNAICKLLKLAPVDAKTLKVVSPCKVEETVTKECVVCLDMPRSVICRPCGHWCLCSSCHTTMTAAGAGFSCPLCSVRCKEVLEMTSQTGLGTYTRDSMIKRAVKRRKME
eukprot:TRINITY_DN5616_c0_g1_i1.p1 TRINITY_DN5616_c0_g1~~TRINITY_DN5616_c0_g1_i1.p1  ORF type:complete len:661 (+),score=80.82 TRINITY_DN5616_c0_g1_i1:87-2069(+)